ncbi:unnamed protein product [Closterium sp. Naga37s-1]|nr:unnamed protein product [Closterium sp. Naga37s-1]
MRVPVVASPPISHPSQHEGTKQENAGESTPSGARRSLVGSAARTKTGPVASPQPAWFPRVKLEPYLTRRLRELQEEVGPQPPLEQLLIPSKLGRLEREKQEAAMAAKRASQLRQVALVEASWCRILDAAGIPSTGALEVAQQAEEEAHVAVVEAAKLGVILDHAVTSRSRNGSPRAAAAAAAAAGSAFSAAAAAAAAAAASAADDELMAASALAGALSSRDVILTSVSTAQAVEKDVVLAVMKALSRVGNIRAADGIVDFVDWEVKEGEEREGEEEALGRECGVVEVEKGDGGGGTGEDGNEADEEKGVGTGEAGEWDGAEGETGELEVEKEEGVSDGNESQGDAISKEEATEANLEVGNSVAAASAATAEGTAAEEPTAEARAEEGGMGEGSVTAGAGMQEEEKEVGKTGNGEEEEKDGKEEEKDGKEEGKTGKEEEEMNVPAVIAERVLALNRNHRTALAAIVASRGMVNGLLQGLRNGRRQSFSASASRRQSLAALSQIGGTGDAGPALAKVGESKGVAGAGGTGEAEQAQSKEGGGGGASGGDAGTSSGSGDLGSILVKKLSRLEREKAAAVEERKREEEERRKAKTEKKGGESVSGVNVGWGAEGLGSGIKHVSRIDRELAAAREAERKAQGRGAGVAAPGAAGGAGGVAAAGSKNGVRVGRRERVEVGSVPSLDSMLVKGKSRLQREKEQAAEAAKQAWGTTGGNGTGTGAAGGKGAGRRERVEVGSVPGLDSMLVVRHKSKLEREMEEERKWWGESQVGGSSSVVRANGAGEGGRVDGGPKGGRRERVEEGSVPGLGEMLVKHKSRLEREKEEAAAWARGAGGSGGGTGADSGAGGANGADGVDGGGDSAGGGSKRAGGGSGNAVVDAGWGGCGLADVLKKPAVKGGAEQVGEGATTDAAAVTGEGHGEGGVDGNENAKGNADGSSRESGGVGEGVENRHSEKQKQQQQQQGLGLGEGVKKMSRLERELMEARALKECVGEAGNGGKAGSGRMVDAWGGVGLGDTLKKHVSKMERAKV